MAHHTLHEGTSEPPNYLHMIDHVCGGGAGSAFNHAGRSSGLTSPHGPAQTALVRSALAAASVWPQEVALVSVHGTGTPLGDPIEVGALGQALARPSAHAAERLILGDAHKSSVGHVTAAASPQSHNARCLL